MSASLLLVSALELGTAAKTHMDKSVITKQRNVTGTVALGTVILILSKQVGGTRWTNMGTRVSTWTDKDADYCYVGPDKFNELHVDI